MRFMSSSRSQPCVTRNTASLSRSIGSWSCSSVALIVSSGTPTVRRMCRKSFFGNFAGRDGGCALSPVLTLREPVTGIEYLRARWRGWYGLPGAGWDVSRRSQENLAPQPSRRSRAGRVLYGVDASFMQVEAHGWDIDAVSAPGRRAPPVTPGRVVRWRITASAPRGRPGRAAARPDDTNAASTGRAPRQPLAKIYRTGLTRRGRGARGGRTVPGTENARRGWRPGTG